MSGSFYQGADVSSTFMSRWRSGHHLGPARPYAEVWVRRGRLIRSFHDNWPGAQFGRVYGHPITHQWYPDWTPLDDWTQLPGVREIDLDQTFESNGIATASITCDNVAWEEAFGVAGPYHTRQRGYLWPWRGYTPPTRPGSGVAKNDWYTRLPNAQILVYQGYGSDTKVKTFTGLIDNLDGAIRPDQLVLTSRDFGGVLTDSYAFGWNKYKGLIDPISFVPPDYERLKWAQNASSSQQHRWVVVDDVTDIVRCCLRWCGFKEWQIDDAGVPLRNPVTYDKTHSMMDIINEVATALGYAFFMGEPTNNNDLSMGVPIFRRPSVVISERSQPIVLDQNQLLTDLKPKHDNKNDRYIIRVRGVVKPKVGRKLGGDTFKRVTFTYWPPWIKNMAGVIKQLTYYNIGDKNNVGLQSVEQCRVAVMLIALQIALGRDTGVAQCPGQPAYGLDSFAFINDSGSGVVSRLYVSNRKSVMRLGGDGSSQGSSSGSQTELLWATEIGGSLCDNPEFDHIVKDYQKAITGQPVISWGPIGWD